MNEEQHLDIEYFTDILCIWAYIGQVRVDELLRNFPGQLRFRYRYIPLFGAAHDKIERDWKDKGGAKGYNAFQRETAAQWKHIHVHPELWLNQCPRSSTVPHLFLKAVDLLLAKGEHEHDGDGHSLLEETICRVREAFFRDARNISDFGTLDEVAEDLKLPHQKIRRLLDTGEAHAALHADSEAYHKYQVPGSPTFIFNEGRQRLYGNLGYRIIEANVNELLKNPEFGQASWC
ncbi:MAG: DsbA family protein [Chromatiales bacterium]|nr:DsbA family protein [Chromatiales bacterium]